MHMTCGLGHLSETKPAWPTAPSHCAAPLSTAARVLCRNAACSIAISTHVPNPRGRWRWRGDQDHEEAHHACASAPSSSCASTPSRVPDCGSESSAEPSTSGRRAGRAQARTNRNLAIHHEADALAQPLQERRARYRHLNPCAESARQLKVEHVAQAATHRLDLRLRSPPLCVPAYPATRQAAVEQSELKLAARTGTPHTLLPQFT
jgi:hypothetical protein